MARIRHSQRQVRSIPAQILLQSHCVNITPRGNPAPSCVIFERKHRELLILLLCGGAMSEEEDSQVEDNEQEEVVDEEEEEQKVLGDAEEAGSEVR